MAEGAPLLREYRVYSPIEGSNPSLSATSDLDCRAVPAGNCSRQVLELDDWMRKSLSLPFLSLLLASAAALAGAAAARAQDEAFEELIAAATEGDVDSQFSLATAYERGTRTQVDFEQAAYWYRKAAEQGHGKAQNNLGYLYEQGRGVEVFLERAKYWYELSARQGNGIPAYNLGNLLQDNPELRSRPDEALHWYEIAARLGVSQAYVQLGMIHSSGEDGIPQDDAAAKLWYKQAVNLGNTAAMYNLGVLYDYGSEAGADYEQAALYYALAAASGHAKSQHNLGLLYFGGKIGGRPDMWEAYLWLRNSELNGHEQARRTLDRITDRLTFQEKERAETAAGRRHEMIKANPGMKLEQIIASTGER